METITNSRITIILTYNILTSKISMNSTSESASLALLAR